jgi:hypothetical protein
VEAFLRSTAEKRQRIFAGTRGIAGTQSPVPPNCTTERLVYWSEFLSTDPEIQVRFPALRHLLRSSGSRTGPLSLVSKIEELLGKNCSGSGLEIREYGRGDPLRCPRDTFYPEKLALISPTSGCRSFGIVCWRTKAKEFTLLSLLNTVFWM